jgi:hypothetical protein
VIPLILGKQGWRLVSQLRAAPSAPFSWRREIWPLQWRLAASVSAGYFVYALFTPVVFRFHGAVPAGQTGMSLAAASIITGIGYKWTEVRSPEMAIHVARGRYDLLDRTFQKAFRTGTVAATIGSLLLLAALILARGFEVPAARRLVSAPVMGLFLVGGIAETAIISLNFYLRAHKEDPALVVTLATAALMGVMVMLMGWAWGSIGAAAASAIVSVGVRLPMIHYVYRRFRRDRDARWIPERQPPEQA